MKKTRKPLAIVVASALVAALGIGSTVAWLTDQSDKVENTFTVGNIDITLAETEADDDQNANVNSYKMVPGNEIAKDPTVKVLGGSEACYLFVQVTESSTLSSYIDYTMASGWIPIEDGDSNELTKLYYREVRTDAADQAFGVIGYQEDASTFVANKVLVKTEVTKTMMDNINDGTVVQPKLDFKAYAVQKENIDSAAKAWDEASK